MNASYIASCPKRPSRTMSAAIAAITILGLGAAGIVAAPIATARTNLPAPTAPPTGGDPHWESLAQKCYKGSMRACDSLADQTEVANAPVYHDYGFSCGGRVSYNPTGQVYNYCIDQFPDHP
ncbi:hypothetical protein ACIRRA_36750 [Nocardia sp. NPDC101769]|uniref:hypothetical protein n=1 Tax=Nocardia sp. NPDC101769 TaxID=3364333 RepID=UPI00381FD417